MPTCRHYKTKFDAKYFNQKFCLSDDECIKAFNDVYNSVKETICKWIGVTNEMVEEQIEQYY